MTPYTPGRHVIGALVQNEQGVLAGVANLFAGRGYNIDSLVVGRTEIPELSRITIVVVGNHDVASINQVKSPLILAPWLH
jgi:acetolactate synthase-1/3 small subunit